MLKNIVHIENRLSRCFNLHFKKNIESYQISVAEKYVLFLSLIMFYHNRTEVIYKLIVSSIYSFIDNFICIDYLGILKTKSAYDNKLGKTKFNVLSVLGISEIMMNIMSCNGFSKVTTSTLILTYCSAFVPHCLSKGFIIVEKLDGIFENILNPVLNQINDFPLYDEDIILECKEAIKSIVKTLNKIGINIYIYTTIFSLVGMMIDILNTHY